MDFLPHIVDFTMVLSPLEYLLEILDLIIPLHVRRTLIGFHILKFYIQLWPSVPPDKRPRAFLCGFFPGRYPEVWIFGQLMPTLLSTLGINPFRIAYVAFKGISGLIWIIGDDINLAFLEIVTYAIDILSNLWKDCGLMVDPLEYSSAPNSEADSIVGTHNFAGNVSDVDFNLQNSEVFCQSIGLFQDFPTTTCTGYHAKGILDVNIDLSSISSSHLAGKALSAALMARPSVSLVVDTGATMTSTSNRLDFFTFSDVGYKNCKLDGIAEGLQIEDQGTVEYIVEADDGTEYTLTLDAYYIPVLDKQARLLSPQATDTKEGHNCSFVAHTNWNQPSSFAEWKIVANTSG